MRTAIFRKLAASAINACVAIVLSLPIALIFDFSTGWRFSAVSIFFLLQVLDTHRHAAFLCLGIRVIGTRWERRYSEKKKALYSVLYTLSCATLFVHLYAPFDIFLTNMLLLQLPTVFLTETTFHGWLAGGMWTVRAV
jgi:hypothetical protein